MSDAATRVAQLKDKIRCLTPQLPVILYQIQVRACHREIREIQDKCFQLGGHAWGVTAHNRAEEVWTRTCKECDYTEETEEFTIVKEKVPKWE
jgi:hypothetical protein